MKEHDSTFVSSSTLSLQIPWYEYSNERHREALQNLQELELICRPGLAHEYVHITEEGWENLGGEMPRYGSDVSPQSSPTCKICATDEALEANWS